MNHVDEMGEESGVSVYRAKGRIGWQAAGFLAGGILFLLSLVVRFIVLVGQTSKTAHDRVPGMLGGMSVVGIALIARGLFLLRSVVQVRLDPAGIHLSRQSIAWDQIDRVDRDKRSQLLGGQTHKVLNLIGHDGKLIAFIPDTIDRFEQLAEEIVQTSAFARGRETYDPVANAERVRSRDSKKSRRSGILALLMSAGFAAGLIAGIYEEVHLRRYATEGVVTDAKITHRYMVRVTPRLEYSFRDASGASHTREAMMDQEPWDALQGSTTVPIQYLPSNPDWNRLLSGEQDSATFSGKFMILSGGMMLLLGVLGVMSIAGFDLKIEDGKTSITRHGTLIKSFGQSRGIPDLSSIAPAGHPIPQSASQGALVPQSLSTLSVPPASRKPPGIVALGILSLAFGAIGVLLGVVRILLMVVETLDLGNQTFVLEVSQYQKYWWVVDGVLGLLLVCVGIGLLMVRNWGRRLGMFVALLQVISSLAGVIVAGYVFGKVHPGAGPNSTGAAAAGVGAIIGQFLGGIFPAILLLNLARRTTAEAFEAATQRRNAA